jgi:hypothetical protein
MTHDPYSKVRKLTDVANKKYATHAYAAGYFGSMVSGMMDELRMRGTKDTKEMADYYDRLLSNSIINIISEDK